MRPIRFVTICAAVLLLGSPPAKARPPNYSDWPLERIISNLEDRLATAPDDSLHHYNLGRAHGFAFAMERSSLWIAESRDNLWVGDLEVQKSRSRYAKEDARRYRRVRLDLPSPPPSALL